ncbi:hypothetical protein [Peterkaempfera sp. SMS 1(5)a]|uniref:WXG100-like domain-containing protein n=1 Tax=Peterkaempfera podocarpi TaxID=3232308 RepID=UPI00366FA6C2
MAIELPGEVVSFLQFIGVNWPQVNEDSVREFGVHVREFADNLSRTHENAGSTIQQLGEAYQGAGYEVLAAKWAQLSDTHMRELIEACHVVSTALDLAADAIIAMKVEAIGELIGMAAAFVADQAAAVVTFGAAEAALLLIEEAAEKLVDFLVQQMEQYIIGQVMEAAINPLIETVEKAVSGLAYHAVESALGVSGDGSVGEGFRIQPDAVMAHAQTMRQHAEEVRGHGDAFLSKLSGVSFE